MSDDGHTLPIDEPASHPVLEAERARARALVAGDRPAVERLLAEELRYIHATGVVHDRAGYLAYLAGGPRFHEVTLGEARVLDLGDAALLTGRLLLRFQRPGEATVQQAQSFVTALWRRQGGDWRLTAFQSTRDPSA